MEFRNNIIFSVIAHTMIFVAALAMARREPTPRVPVKYIAVTLLEYVAAGKPAPKNGEKDAAPPHVTTPLRLRDAALPEVPPPAKAQKEPRAIVPPKKDDMRGENLERAVSGPVGGSATSLPGETGGISATSVGIMDHDAISPSVSTRQATAGPKGNAAGGSAGILATIRSAIEKAKSYPPLARRRGLEGTVTAEFTINLSGHPENIRIVQSSGYEILDDAAKKTLLRASPYPPVRGTLEVPITFRIEK